MTQTSARHDRSSHPLVPSYSGSELAERAELAVRAAHAAGATAAQVSIGHSVGLSVEVRARTLDRLEFERDQLATIVAYCGQRKAQTTTTDLSPGAIEETARAAVSIARVVEEDPWAGLPEGDEYEREFPDLDLDHPWAIDADAAIALASEIEAFGLDSDSRVVNSEGASVSTRHGFSVLADSSGFVGLRSGTRHDLGCSLVARGAGGGMERDHAWCGARGADALWSSEKLGREAAERACRRLDPRKVVTCEAPVVFVPELAAGLIGTVLRALGGGAQYRRASFLLNALGERLGPEWLTIFEDPRRKGGLSSSSFDSEGVATRTQSFVESGRIVSYRLDSYSARRLKRKTTGNAGGARNVQVSSNHHGGLDALLAEVGRGLLVTELIGQGTNLMTGDYSRGASGFWIENGQIAYPVSEITIAGDMRDMLDRIVAIGDDHDPRLSTAVGSLWVERMTVAGD
ncbi:MAG: metallopeptidase TldD-related protein [Thioalkalivibrionaceae bacterium]